MQQGCAGSYLHCMHPQCIDRTKCLASYGVSSHHSIPMVCAEKVLQAVLFFRVTGCVNPWNATVVNTTLYWNVTNDILTKGCGKKKLAMCWIWLIGVVSQHTPVVGLVPLAAMNRPLMFCELICLSWKSLHTEFVYDVFKSNPFFRSLLYKKDGDFLSILYRRKQDRLIRGSSPCPAEWKLL